MPSPPNFCLFRHQTPAPDLFWSRVPPPSTICLGPKGSSHPFLFSSPDCAKACLGCMGAGPGRCKKCSPGYQQVGSKCLGESPASGAQTP